MASFAQLPDELRRLLETVTGSFASTATSFLNAIPNPEQHFARACEILNTVSNTANEWRPIERAIGFRLNAIFTLYWLYREYDIRLNPFASHFVEICETDRRPPNGSAKESQVDRLQRARSKMIMGILGGEGSKLGELSAKDFFARFDELRLGESTNLKAFANSLNDDDEAPVQAWSNSSNQTKSSTNGYHPNSKQKAVGSPSPAPGQNKSLIFIQNHYGNQIDREAGAFIEQTLSNAQVRHLDPKEKSMLLNNIDYAGRIYQATYPEVFKRMLDLNFDITQALAVEVLKTSSERIRSSMLDTVLPNLNLELRSLDLLNHLVVRLTKDELRSSRFSANDGANITILSLAERTHLLHVFIANCIRQMELPYEDFDDIPVSTRRAKINPEIARKVKLLCMFITNLLRREVITAEEFQFETQNIFISFMGVKEARELWQNVNPSGTGF